MEAVSAENLIRGAWEFCEFDTNVTFGSVRRFLKQYAELPEEERSKYQKHINIVYSTMREFGKGNLDDQKMTDKQLRRICLILDAALNPLTAAASKLYQHAERKAAYIDYIGIEYKDADWGKPNVSKGTYVVAPYIPVDDPVYSIIFNLIAEFRNQSILSSCYNNIVLEYQEIMQAITDEEPEYYSDLNREIQAHLMLNGWSGNGFYSEPKRTVIADAIYDVAKKYLKDFS